VTTPYYLESSLRTVPGLAAWTRINRRPPLLGLYAESARVLRPLCPGISPLVAGDDFRRHAAAVLGRLDRPGSHRVVDVVVHAMADPELIVTEFRCEVVRSGMAMMMPCVWLTRVWGGRIVEARDCNGDPGLSGPSAWGTR
jgi:ketosteroid isomerase-like protein